MTKDVHTHCAGTHKYTHTDGAAALPPPAHPQVKTIHLCCPGKEEDTKKRQRLRGTKPQLSCALVNRFTSSQSCILCAVLYSLSNNLNNLGTRLNNCMQNCFQGWFTDHLWCYFVKKCSPFDKENAIELLRQYEWCGRYWWGLFWILALGWFLEWLCIGKNLAIPYSSSYRGYDMIHYNILQYRKQGNILEFFFNLLLGKLS